MNPSFHASNNTMAPGPSHHAATPYGNDYSGNSVNDMFIDKFRSYIDLIDDLRSYGLDKEVSLPQVVVFGVQSSGKSSVLEAISGVALPRGTGIVTRCPLELRLKYSKAQSQWKCTLKCQPPGSTQLHTVDILSPDDVSNQILRAQSLLTQNAGISAIPIILEITSSDVPNLTLIDLPGLTEVGIGDQGDNVVKEIRELAENYIKRKDTLILVVAAANADLATTKALSMANEADKDGERTIGVLTKADLVDPGAEKDIVRIMLNPVTYKVKKGFTLVKLRGQQSVAAGQSREEALKQEQAFFRSKPEYNHVNSKDLGVHNLSKKLTDQLVLRIQNSIPELKEAVTSKLEETTQQLKKLGNDIPREGAGREKAFRDMLDNFKELVRKVCEGPYDNDISVELRLLFHIRPKMEDFAQHMIQKLPNESEPQFWEDTKREIAQTRGGALPGFLPFQACKNIIQIVVDSLREPVGELLRDYNTEVDKALRLVAEETLKSYPSLSNQVRALLDEARKEAYRNCMEDIEEMFNIEKIVTVPDMLFRKYDTMVTMSRHNSRAQQQQHQQQAAPNVPPRAAVAGTSVPNQQQQHPQQQQEIYQQSPTNDVEFVIKQIITYIQMTIDRITGVVPMRVHHHLITKLHLTIRSRMTELGCDYPKMDSLIEDDFTRQQIEDLSMRKECLEKSYHQLSDF